MIMKTAGKKTERLSNPILDVSVDSRDLSISIKDRRNGSVWKMEPEKGKGSASIETPYGFPYECPLATAKVRSFKRMIRGEYSGFEVLLGGFEGLGQWGNPSNIYDQNKAFLRFVFLVHCKEPDLIVEVAPSEENGFDDKTWIRTVSYPRPFTHDKSRDFMTLIPYRAGTMIPGNMKEGISNDNGVIPLWGYENVNMPWWGAVNSRKAGYLAIMDTPCDAQLQVVHPAGGPTSINARWLPSFQALRYTRRIIYSFLDNADHCSVAKRYRKYAIGTGRFKSLRDKISERPLLSKLYGAVLDCEVGEGQMIKRKNLRPGLPEHRNTTLKERLAIMADAAKKFKGENVLSFVRGWQKEGFDRLHPAAMPPCEEVGGWDGLALLSRKAEEYGFLFALHDQYRDFFLESPVFSEDLTLKNCRGESPRHFYWAGGTQSILCAKEALFFVKKDIQLLVDHGVKLTANYNDVLSGVPLEECYDHRHRMSRRECMEARAGILEHISSLGQVASSESVNDWTIPCVDFGHLAEPLHWKGRHAGKTMGIPVPLFSLVYHDAIVLMSRRNVQPLNCMLWGLNTANFADREIRKLHKAVAAREMLSHSFLDRNFKRQKVVYEGGIEVEADFSTGRHSIKGIGAVK
ncbi:MAG TPA: hypothetical protein DET40_25485 [Lentisphaeria bacterium]|nr:MAG: hypothetical protein A2X45_18480 [Lentisphaerae bacterium GWF2_50_93]HCE46914.1 hypothetical protein [Lentisphaeria bacterium]